MNEHTKKQKSLGLSCIGMLMVDHIEFRNNGSKHFDTAKNLLYFLRRTRSISVESFLNTLAELDHNIRRKDASI